MTRGFDPEDGSCLECEGHAVERRNSQTQQTFHGCSNFPTCLNSEPIRRRGGDFLASQEDLDLAFYEAFYDGDG